VAQTAAKGIADNIRRIRTGKKLPHQVDRAKGY